MIRPHPRVQVDVAEQSPRLLVRAPQSTLPIKILERSESRREWQRERVLQQPARSLSRNRHKDCLNTSAKMPAINDPAIAEGRTKFPNTVVPVEGRRVLKDGSNSCKTGNRIIKGDWHGFRIHTLSLEERSTCPVICEHWRSCFGNNTPFAE